MKKVILTISVLLNLVLILIGAGFPVKDTNEAVKKASSCGYTIIEFGKGVDCKGDTIRLVKRNGVQVRAQEVF